MGLEESGGSTPLRLRVETATEGTGTAHHLRVRQLFAMNHVQADRWYKIGRRILYGRLEDEAPSRASAGWSSTRTTLSGCWAPGVPTATPYGIVEITPEARVHARHQLHRGAVEIGEADVDDAVIDQALGIMRVLWGAGLAHPGPPAANSRSAATSTSSARCR